MLRLIIAVGLILFVSTGWASNVVFDDIDVNGDGYISKTEAASRTDLKENWSKIDADKDGQLNVSEFSAFEGKFVPAEDLERPEIGASPTK